jgi:hypothetical protein
MTYETVKAFMMIAMFGILEFALYFPRIREFTISLRKGVASFLMPIAISEPARVAVRVRREVRDDLRWN